MATVESTGEPVSVDVENIGGIDHTSTDLEPGVTVLAGRNATNRTSFLRALMAGLGSDDISLKGDADEGQVVLEIGEERYVRTIERRNGTIVSGGDPYLDDAELADLFAFLLETNEARRAVAMDANLREILMRPIDVEEIKATILQLQNEKRAVDEELERLEELDRERTELVQERAEIEDRLEELEPALEEARRAVESAEEEGDRSDRDDELQAELDELQSIRSELADVRFDIDTERESLRSLEEQRESLVHQRSDLPETAEENVDQLRSEVDRLRGRQRELDATISQLQNVIQFNREMLDDPGETVTAFRGTSDGSGSVTDQLVDGEGIVCWTCGTRVGEDRIERAIGKLQDLRERKSTDRRELRRELDDLKERLSEIRNKREERARLEETYDRVVDEIEEREERLHDLEERETELETTVEELEEAVEAREHKETSDILERQREASRIEFELEQERRRLDSVERDLERIEDRLEDREQLERRRERVQQDLEDERTKIERIEEESIEAFNDHMSSVLEILEYQNLDRIWIERVDDGGGAGGSSGGRRFELHVTRSTDDGTVYRDSIDHLSESEREVTGLVFALAGYLVHQVHDRVPFMLLDSLEALDSERISKLLEYFREYAPYIVVALLPEDAAAVDEGYQRITDI